MHRSRDRSAHGSGSVPGSTDRHPKSAHEEPSTSGRRSGRDRYSNQTSAEGGQHGRNHSSTRNPWRHGHDRRSKSKSPARESDHRESHGGGRLGRTGGREGRDGGEGGKVGTEGKRDDK